MSDALEKARHALNRQWNLYIGRLFGEANYITAAIEALVDVKVNAILDAREAKAEPAKRGPCSDKCMAGIECDSACRRPDPRDALIAELERERDEAHEHARQWQDRKHVWKGCAEKAEAALAELRGRVEKARKLASRKVHELGSNPVTALADVAALLSPEGEAKRGATSTEALGRFGHHPDPAIDFEVEVCDIEGSAYEAIAGHLDRTALLDRAERALSFRVGAVESCINAKATLRKIVADLKAPTLAQPARDTDPVPATDAREAAIRGLVDALETIRSGDWVWYRGRRVFGEHSRCAAKALIAARAAGITGKGTSDE
jgi:hypothetical protein